MAEQKNENLAGNENPENTTNTTPKKKAKRERTSNYTWDGHPLTESESRFIDDYCVNGVARQAYLVAYPNSNPKNAHQNAWRLLNKEYVASEIQHRLELAKTQSIADANEIMQYFTDVMRGEKKDQFGLEAPLAERTKAAIELAKRQIDIPQRLSNNEPPQLKIVLDWARPEVREDVSISSSNDGNDEIGENDEEIEET